jgi:hypothetical protein
MSNFFGCFIFRLHFGIHCDTNGCTDFTDFTDAVRIFFYPNALFRAKNKKNPYRIREIRKIRTSIRIAMYPKVEPKNETSLRIGGIRKIRTSILSAFFQSRNCCPDYILTNFFISFSLMRKK